MPRKLVSELIVPAEVGRGLIVNKGQTLRIIAIEGPIVCDVTFLNAHNHKETYDSAFSYGLNRWQRTGNYHQFRYMYSKLPWGNVMVEITDDKVARHWLINGGHCSSKSTYFRRQRPSARSCHGNVAEVLSEYGMTIDEVPNTFPLWMYIEDLPSGDYVIHPSPSKKGDYIDFLARMDVLVAISSCPGNDPEAFPVIDLNAGANRPVKAEVWEDS